MILEIDFYLKSRKTRDKQKSPICLVTFQKSITVVVGLGVSQDQKLYVILGLLCYWDLATQAIPDYLKYSSVVNLSQKQC